MYPTFVFLTAMVQIASPSSVSLIADGEGGGVVVIIQEPVDAPPPQTNVRSTPAMAQQASPLQTHSPAAKPAPVAVVMDDSTQPHEALPAALGKTRRSGLMVHDTTGWLVGQRKDPYHARITADCGLASVAEADYGRDHITVMKMKSPLGALCAFTHEKTLDAQPLSSFNGPESEGYRIGNRYVARTASFVVIQRTSGKTISPTLLEVVMSELPHLSERDPEIASLDVLPKNDRIPSSEHFISSSALGYTVFGSGFAADFACGESGSATIAALRKDDARELIAGFHEETLRRGAQVKRVSTMGAELWTAQLSSEQLVYLVRVGAKFVAIESDTPITKCGGLLPETVANLRGSASVAEATPGRPPL